MIDDYRIQLGRRIREQRIAHGYRNGKDFARALGLDASQLSRMERGLRRIDSMLLRRIAELLAIPLDTLFPNDRNVAAAARQGDGDSEQMRGMIDWAIGLRTDLDVVAEYVAGSRR